MIKSNELPLIWLGKLTNYLRLLEFNIDKNSIVFDEITSLTWMLKSPTKIVLASILGNTLMRQVPRKSHNLDDGGR